MHAGNVFAALVAWIVAAREGGAMVLRIEDLDRQRSRREYADAIMRDLELLGLPWDEGPYLQSDRTEAYEEAFRLLEDTAGVYPCFCTRADLHAASAPHAGERPVYAGTCRALTPGQRDERARTKDPAWRLRVPDRTIAFDDGFQGRFAQDLVAECGDFVVKRADGAFAYQLAVVVDDAAQHVTSIVRGCDLLDSTPQQLFLQEALGLPHPSYAHIPLLVAQDGRRLSKRDHDADLEALIKRHRSPEGVIGHIAALTGLIPEDRPVSAAELLERADLGALTGKKAIRWQAGPVEPRTDA